MGEIEHQESGISEGESNYDVAECEECGVKFNPTPGKVNKFCSNSCHGRSRRQHYSTHRLEGGHGYEQWVSDNSIAVHTLLVIAEGADPHEVFSGENNVDHINGCKIDNRPSNVELVDVSEHGRKDGKRWSKYKHKKTLKIVERIASEVDATVEECLEYADL